MAALTAEEKQTLQEDVEDFFREEVLPSCFKLGISGGEGTFYYFDKKEHCFFPPDNGDMRTALTEAFRKGYPHLDSAAARLVYDRIGQSMHPSQSVVTLKADAVHEGRLMARQQLLFEDGKRLVFDKAGVATVEEPVRLRRRGVPQSLFFFDERVSGNMSDELRAHINSRGSQRMDTTELMTLIVDVIRNPVDVEAFLTIHAKSAAHCDDAAKCIILLFGPAREVGKTALADMVRYSHGLLQALAISVDKTARSYFVKRGSAGSELRQAQRLYSRARYLIIDEVGRQDTDTPVVFETLKTWQTTAQPLYAPGSTPRVKIGVDVLNSRLFCLTGNAETPTDAFVDIAHADTKNILCINFGTMADDGYAERYAAARRLGDALKNGAKRRQLAQQWWALMADYACKPMKKDAWNMMDKFVASGSGGGASAGDVFTVNAKTRHLKVWLDTNKARFVPTADEDTLLMRSTVWKAVCEAPGGEWATGHVKSLHYPTRALDEWMFKTFKKPVKPGRGGCLGYPGMKLVDGVAVDTTPADTTPGDTTPGDTTPGDTAMEDTVPPAPDDMPPDEDDQQSSDISDDDMPPNISGRAVLLEAMFRTWHRPADPDGEDLDEGRCCMLWRFPPTHTLEENADGSFTSTDRCVSCSAVLSTTVISAQQAAAIRARDDDEDDEDDALII